MCRKSGKNISINRSIDYCALSPFLFGRQTVRSLETESVKEKASDIHFEPFEKEFKIRYRVKVAIPDSILIFL